MERRRLLQLLGLAPFFSVKPGPVKTSREEYFLEQVRSSPATIGIIEEWDAQPELHAVAGSRLSKLFLRSVHKFVDKQLAAGLVVSIRTQKRPS